MQVALVPVLDLSTPLHQEKATVLPQVPSQITPKVDWGKPFTPPYSKGAPGGISTEELARAFVDKGNWPVRTTFGLLYNIPFRDRPPKEEKR